MSFITERRLFSKQVKPTLFLGYIFDLIMVFVVWTVIADNIPQLRRFLVGAEQVVAPPAAIAGIGFLFFYGIRLSMYVAMIRRNRAPQVLEWWCMLIGLVIPLGVWMFDGLLLKAYASASGYEFCHRTASTPLVQDLFVIAGKSCPPG